MITYIVPVGKPVVETVGRDKPMQITVQECDMFIVGQRHPLAYKARVVNLPLEIGVKHFIGGNDLFQAGRYGPQINQYGVEWIPAKQFAESMTEILK